MIAKPLSVFLLAVTALLHAPLAHAQTADIVPGDAQSSFALTEKELAALSKNSSVVHVIKDDEGDAAAKVFGAIEIDAPQSVIWEIMLDCAQAPALVRGLKSCKIVEADPDGLWDVREHRISYSFLFSDVVNIFRSDYTPFTEIRFHLVGGDLKVQEGAWTLENIDTAHPRTRVVYNARLAIGKPVPRFLVRRGVRKDVPRILEALKEKAEQAARANTEGHDR